MSEQTVNYHFIKPQPEDLIDIQDLDDNFDSIDTILKEQEDALEGLTPGDIGAQPQVKRGTITFSTSWTGSASPFSQTVTVSGATVTANSKIDLQPSRDTVSAMMAAGMQALLIENNNGTLTAWLFGNKNTTSLTVQCTVTEVNA